MSDFIAGNRIELLRAGPEYFPALEAACDAAVREIYLETYILEDDPTGQRIAAALARAATRNHGCQGGSAACGGSHDGSGVVPHGHREDDHGREDEPDDDAERKGHDINPAAGTWRR